MKKKLLLTLEIDLSDLTPEERERCAEMECVEPKDLPRLKEVEADELAWLIAHCIPAMGPEFFAGSNTYAKFVKVDVKSSTFV